MLERDDRIDNPFVLHDRRRNVGRRTQSDHPEGIVGITGERTLDDEIDTLGGRWLGGILQRWGTTLDWDRGITIS